METQRYVDQFYQGPLRFEGYLKKLKSSGSISRIFSKFNTRFFTLDLKSYFFEYKKKINARKVQKFSLAELIYVECNPKIGESCDWQFGFSVRMKKKVFWLYAKTYLEYQKWCEILKACMKPLERNLYCGDVKSEGLIVGNWKLPQTPKFCEAVENRRFAFEYEYLNAFQEKPLLDVSNCLENRVDKTEAMTSKQKNEKREFEYKGAFISFQSSPVSCQSFESDSNSAKFVQLKNKFTNIESENFSAPKLSVYRSNTTNFSQAPTINYHIKEKHSSFPSPSAEIHTELHSKKISKAQKSNYRRPVSTPENIPAN